MVSDPVGKATDIIQGSLNDAEAPCATSGFQLGGVVLLHLVRAIGIDIPVLLIDSGYLPAATIEFAGTVCDEFGLSLDVVRSEQTVPEFELDHGGPLYSKDPDLCCTYRRVEPGHAALSAHDRWLTALRRSQSPSRRDVEASAVVGLQNGAVIRRVAPLVDWEWADVESYAEVHSLPRHPYYSQGYSSIGCAPCTRPTWSITEDRSGRWNGEKVECGLQRVAAVPVDVLSIRSA